jgi:GNAT superfamily N-acetyltransferase
MNDLEVRPVRSGDWDDLVRLFGDNGAYANCWCMWWRVTSTEFDQGVKAKGAGNRAAMKALVDDGAVPGLIAWRGDEPVGWISVAPRSEFGRIERSPVLKGVDDEPAWAVVCFYIPRRERGAGVATALLDAALRWVREQGGRLVEGYPTPAHYEGAAALWTGTESMFAKAGFTEVARRQPKSRSIWRRRLRPR